MLIFGSAAGLLLLVIGLLTVWLAPRAGPNAVFGFRVGYAFANRETWDRTNRLGGILFAFVGLGTFVLAVVLAALDVSLDVGMTLLTIVPFAGLIGAVIWATLYARSLARHAPAARTLARLRFRWRYIAPVLATFSLLVVQTAVFYPLLPDKVASHFNFFDQPDGWMPRGSFLLFFLGLASLVVLLDALIVILATREPLIAVGRWENRWWLSPERGLEMTASAFSVLNLLLGILLINVAWFNLYGALLFSFSLLLWLTVPLIALFLAFFFLLAGRPPETS